MTYQVLAAVPTHLHSQFDVNQNFGQTLTFSSFVFLDLSTWWFSLQYSIQPSPSTWAKGPRSSNQSGISVSRASSTFRT